MFEHHDYLSWNSSLPPWLSDFAILIPGHLWRWQVEWLAHYPLAIKAGLSETVAADLKTSRRPQPTKPDKAAVCDFWTDLSTKHEVSDDVCARVKAVLTNQQIVGLIGPSGTYLTVAMLLAAAEKWVPQASSTVWNRRAIKRLTGTGSSFLANSGSTNAEASIEVGMDSNGAFARIKARTRS